ncbi:MAG: peptide-methionine (S)-S-oxide reductase MsrA [Thiothrix sp.]|nr:peptide-methionine (S)-S-oxide reductase MsrA [Thiothrix sp.]HPQ95651.1 peptide-methionine (S)-S-oxide reductase MsrA [Thiolinea sp.]
MRAQATFGGGCFWCTEAVFQHLRGVEKVESGYSGGDGPADYRSVCSGRTGHAEVVQITFDPDRIGYEDLLRIHFSTHDPTTLNRQGADTGPQYRSIIFTHDATQQASAEQVLQAMQAYFSAPIVTRIEPLVQFHKAEDYHQNYYRDNPAAGYCQAVIAPKLARFRRQFADRLDQGA